MNEVLYSLGVSKLSSKVFIANHLPSFTENGISGNRMDVPGARGFFLASTVNTIE
jgi:hypothetical protein